jgi:hypothetical protein
VRRPDIFFLASSTTSITGGERRLLDTDSVVSILLDTLAGAFTDRAPLHLPSRLVVAYCQHQGGKLLYFLSGEDKAAFTNAVGVSTVVRVWCPTAALAVTFLVLRVPWTASDKEVGTLLALITSPNPRCKLVSWTRVVHQGMVTNKVTARWTIISEMVLMHKTNQSRGFLSVLHPTGALFSAWCVKRHNDHQCPLMGDPHPPALVTTVRE